MVLAGVVGTIVLARFPINMKLALLNTVLDPVESHVNGLRAALFDAIGSQAITGAVVSFNRGGGLGMSQFDEGGAVATSFLGVEKGGANFRFGGARKDIFHNNAEYVNGCIDERGGRS